MDPLSRNTDPLQQAEGPGRAAQAPNVAGRPTVGSLSPLIRQREPSNSSPLGSRALLGKKGSSPLLRQAMDRGAGVDDPFLKKFSEFFKSKEKQKGGEGEFKEVYPVGKDGGKAEPGSACWAAAVGSFDDLTADKDAYQRLDKFIRVPKVKSGGVQKAGDKSVMFIQWIPGLTLHTKFFNREEGLGEKTTQFLDKNLEGNSEKISNAKKDIADIIELSEGSDVFLKDMQLQMDENTGHVYLIDPEISKPTSNPRLHQQNIAFLKTIKEKLEQMS